MNLPHKHRPYYIYKILFPDGKIYIGQTKNPVKRKNRHKNANIKEDTSVYRAIREIGFDKCVFSIIHECATEKEANEMETFYIESNKSHREEFGYNDNMGKGFPFPKEKTKRKMGESHKGRKHSEESKKKISEKQVGEKNHHFGKTPTEATLEKMSIKASLSNLNKPRIHHNNGSKGNRTERTKEEKQKQIESRQDKRIFSLTNLFNGDRFTGTKQDFKRQYGFHINALIQKRSRLRKGWKLIETIG